MLQKKGLKLNYEKYGKNSEYETVVDTIMETLTNKYKERSDAVKKKYDNIILEKLNEVLINNELFNNKLFNYIKKDKKNNAFSNI